MIISLSNPIIAYSKKGDDFKYERLFIQTVRKYIIEHKNTEYDRLTDKDKSIVLARLIKNMYVNGVPVVEFFKEQIAEWSDKDNFEKNKLVIEMISSEIFGCYDKNRVTRHIQPLLCDSWNAKSHEFLAPYGQQ